MAACAVTRSSGGGWYGAKLALDMLVKGGRKKGGLGGGRQGGHVAGMGSPLRLPAHLTVPSTRRSGPRSFAPSHSPSRLVSQRKYVGHGCGHAEAASIPGPEGACREGKRRRLFEC